MKLLDKLKNIFFEEEYVEVEEKETKKKKEAVAKKIDVKKIDVKETKIEKKEEKKEQPEEIVSDKELLNPDNNFKFPGILDDDFIEEPIKVEKRPFVSYYDKEESTNYGEMYTKKDNDNYNNNYSKKEEKKLFRPSPIISPIYGVLDKNYTKDEIVNKREIHISGSTAYTKVNLDEVRERAYGRLEEKADEIVNDINEAMEEIEEATTLYDMNTDETPVVEKITVGDAEEYFSDLGLEYNVDYKDKHKEHTTRRRSDKTKDVEENDYAEDTLEHSLFDIIDTMYEEKE